MRPPRFGKAPHQHVVRSFKVDNCGRQQRTHLLQDQREAVDRPFTNVHTKHGAGNFIGAAHKLGKLRNQFQWKVVDRVVAKVFKRFERREFSRAGEPGQDHQFAAHRQRPRRCSSLVVDGESRVGCCGTHARYRGLDAFCRVLRAL